MFERCSFCIFTSLNNFIYMQGILLVNVGSPQTKSRKDVKAFVRAMLSDPMVMTVPDWFRPILVDGVILPLRQFSSTKKYSLIWDDEHDASPLVYHMEQLASKLENKIEKPVKIAMRYEEPNIEMALQDFCKYGNIHEVVVVPMFPHYAESSWQTAADEVGRIFMEKPYPYRITFTRPYYSHEGYIEALSDKIRPFLVEDHDLFLFNFHSLPLTHIEKGWKKGREFDYVYQAKETVLLVSKKLNIPLNKGQIVFSSAMGKKWIQPSLDEVVKEAALNGKKRIIITSPGFSSDNLETIYDIHIHAREIFMKHGGESFIFIPCLNSDDCWVEGLAKIITN